MSNPLQSSTRRRRVAENAKEQEIDYLTKQYYQKIPIGNVIAKSIQSDIYQQITPVYPYQPSGNWSTQLPTRGWNQSDLSTYIIPESDRQTIQMFDRFILKDEVNPIAKPRKSNPTLGNLIADRIGRPKHSENIKNPAYRSMINGQTTKNALQSQLKLEDRKSLLAKHIHKK